MNDHETKIPMLDKAAELDAPRLITPAEAAEIWGKTPAKISDWDRRADR